MNVSRRALLATGAAKLVGAVPVAPTPSALVLAGRRFDELKNQLDSSEPVDEIFWSEFRSTANQLVNIMAMTNDEYIAKAKAAAWSRLGDLDPPRSATLDIRIAVSLLRDIILRYEPSLYVSGALARLYAELEGEA